MLLQLFNVMLSMHKWQFLFTQWNIWETVLPNKFQLWRKCKTKEKKFTIQWICFKQAGKKAAFGKEGLWYRYCDIKNNCKWFCVPGAARKQNLYKGNKIWQMISQRTARVKNAAALQYLDGHTANCSSPLQPCLGAVVMTSWPLASPRGSRSARRSWSKRHPPPPGALQGRCLTSCSWHPCSAQNPEQTACKQTQTDPWDVFEKEAGQVRGGKREREGMQAALGLGNNGSSFRWAHPPSAGSSGLLHPLQPPPPAHSKQPAAVRDWGQVLLSRQNLSVLHLLV